MRRGVAMAIVRGQWDEHGEARPPGKLPTASRKQPRGALWVSGQILKRMLRQRFLKMDSEMRVSSGRLNRGHVGSERSRLMESLKRSRCGRRR